MSAAEKLLERMRQTKSGWTPKDFETLYLGFGFIGKEGGNHRTYIHEKYRHLRTQVPRHKPLANYYAKAAVELIDKVKALQAEEAKNDG